MRRYTSALEEARHTVAGARIPRSAQVLGAYSNEQKVWRRLISSAQLFVSSAWHTTRKLFPLCAAASRAVCECVCFAFCAQENQTHRYLSEIYLKRDTKAEIPLCACEYAGGAYCAAAHFQDSQVSAFKDAQE